MKNDLTLRQQIINVLSGGRAMTAERIAAEIGMKSKIKAIREVIRRMDHVGQLHLCDTIRGRRGRVTALYRIGNIPLTAPMKPWQPATRSYPMTSLRRTPFSVNELDYGLHTIDYQDKYEPFKDQIIRELVQSNMNIS